jgi:hypothetical protein
MTTNVENLNQIKDVNDDVLAYYNEEGDVIGANGEAFGFIDENNNICADGEVIASMNENFVVEDDSEANAVFAAATGEEVETAGTDVAEYETQEVAQTAEEDDYEEDVSDNVTIEEIDQMIEFLHDRGLPMEDLIDYPKEVVDIDNLPDHLVDEDGNPTEEFINTPEYGYTMYRMMLDQVMDIIAPRLVDANGDYVYDSEGVPERSTKKLLKDDFAILYTFDKESMSALMEVVEESKKRKDIDVTFDGLMDSLDELTTAMTDKDQGLMARLSRASEKVNVKEWVQYVKDNPGRSATVGAATLGGLVVAGPLGAGAAGAAAAGGGSILDRFRRKKEEDPIILEMLALKKQLELIEKQAPKVYSKLDESIAVIDDLRAQNVKKKKALLITHRRCCVYLSAGEALLEILDNKIVPEYEKAAAESPDSYSAQRKFEEIVSARDALNSRLANINAAIAEGKIILSNNENWSSTLRKFKQKMNEHQASQPILEIQLMNARDILKTTNMAELTIALDRLRDSVLEINSEMGEKTATVAIEAGKRTTTSLKALENSAASGGRTRAQLEASAGASGTAKQRRALLESVDKSITENVGPRRRMIGSNKTEEKKSGGPSKRRSLTDLQNGAANGNDAEAKKAAPGARKKPAGPKPK